MTTREAVDRAPAGALPATAVAAGAGGNSSSVKARGTVDRTPDGAVSRAAPRKGQRIVHAAAAVLVALGSSLAPAMAATGAAGAAGRGNASTIESGATGGTAAAGGSASTIESGAAGASASAAGQTDGPVTFSRDIAPLLHDHCSGCHRADGIAPFALASYADAGPRAAQIAAVTAERRMPPWKPVPGHGRFRNERRLSETELALLSRWAATGAPEGDPADLPEAPHPSDWQLGTPDLIVSMPAPFPLPAGSADVYRNFVLPVALDARRFVRAVELRPGPVGGRVIHHARILLDTTGAARGLDAGDAAPGYDGLMPDHARFPAGHFLGWAPGKTPVALPDDIAWPLDPGTDLVLQLHLLPGPEPLRVQPAVGLHFADRPATRTPVAVLLTSKAIRIPAGAPAHVIEDRYRLPVAVQVLGIAPHMHYLGRRVEAAATLPDGRAEPLLRIDDWDFNRQDEYRYAEPIPLPAGTELSVRFTFDNSAANPRNPHDPPITVGFGPAATDEMAELMLQVLPVGDADALARSLAVKRARDDILGYQSLLRADPTDHVNHVALAVRYLDVGQAALAREHLERAVALAPDFPDAHFNLGAAALAEGDTSSAMAAYRRAVALRPDYPEAHNNLGGLLAATGNGDAAMAHYRLAVRFDPGHSGAHYNLANVLLARGATGEAIRHYRLALEAAPDDAEVLNNLARALVGAGDAAEAAALYTRAIAASPGLAAPRLGLAWIRATASDPALRNGVEAVRLASAALESAGGDHPDALDTLAAAYAAAGRFEEAVSTARRAAGVARSAPRFAPLLAGIEARLKLYLASRPYRAPR